MKAALLVSAIIWSTAATAQVTSYGTASIPNVSATSSYQPPKALPTPPPLPTPLPVATPAPSVASINPSSQQGNQSQNSGSGLNAAIGAALIAAGMAQQPPNIPMLLMGALALAQAGADSGAADQSAATGVASDPSLTTTTPSPTPNPAPGVGTAVPANQSATTQAGLSTLADAGYTVGPTGVTNPDGSTTPSSAFSSAGGMTAAGMDPNTFKEAQKVIAGVTGQSGAGNTSGVGVAEGAGSAAKGQQAPEFELPKFGNPFALNGSQKEGLVAGKMIMFDGEPIGVRAQNIFDMVHAAYDKKRQRNLFIESTTGTPAASGPALRAPASNGPAK